MAQDWPSSQSDTRLKVTEKGVFVGQHQVLSILFEQLGKVGIVCVKTFSSLFLHLSCTIWQCSVISTGLGNLCSKHGLLWLSYN